MPRPDRWWLPLDVDFWDHPQIAEAGEAAGIMYQRLCLWAYRNERDGVIPWRQPGAWYDDWKPRLDALVAVGLVAVDNPERITVLDWSKWHEPVDKRRAREAERREQARERQRRHRSAPHLKLSTAP